MAATLEGTKIVVIGGTSGIGFAVAAHSLQNAASQVTVASSNKERVDKATQEVEEVVKEMREGEQKTRDEMREIREEVTNVRDMLPKVSPFCSTFISLFPLTHPFR